MDIASKLTPGGKLLRVKSMRRWIKCSFLSSRLHKKRLQDQCDHLSALQSWGPELRNFVELPHRPIENNECDVVIEKPTFILKIDASEKFLLHFCSIITAISPSAKVYAD